MKYFVRQGWPSLVWQVVTIDDAQAEGMLKRKTGRVYDTQARAHLVRDRLNDEKKDPRKDR